MSLAARAEGKTASKSKQCSFGRMLAKMDETERAAYEHLLKTVTVTELSYVLREEGYPNDRAMMTRHLKGACTCVAK